MDSTHIMEVDQPSDFLDEENSCLYLVAYDFLYVKEPIESDITLEVADAADGVNKIEESTKNWNIPAYSLAHDAECLIDIAQDEISFISNVKPLKDFESYDMMKAQLMYQNIIPDGDEIFFSSLAGPAKHSGPRALPIELQNTDFSPASSLIVPPNYSFMNGQIGVGEHQNKEKSISDHINDLKASKTHKKLNYSRAVQCLPLPAEYKSRKDLEISDIVPTQDGCHLLVVLNSELENRNSVLLLYPLCFNGQMVKVGDAPLVIREINSLEKPLEINLLSQLEKTTEGPPKIGVDGTVILVCADGAVRVIELCSLKTITVAKLDGEKFVSAAYCNSKLLVFFVTICNTCFGIILVSDLYTAFSGLERLCASTEKGSLHFYALNDTDNESTDDHEEDDLFSFNADLPSASNAQFEPVPDNVETTRCFHEPPDLIPVSELKRLQPLTNFEVRYDII